MSRYVLVCRCANFNIVDVEVCTSLYVEDVDVGIFVYYYIVNIDIFNIHRHMHPWHTKMSQQEDLRNKQSFYRVRIEHALVISSNGWYYFRELHDAKEYIHDKISQEVKEFGETYLYGCDGCTYCCYGDPHRKEWCEVISHRKPQSIKECFDVKNYFPAGHDYCFDINLDMVTWASPCASKFAHVEEIWNLCSNPDMRELSIE